MALDFWSSLFKGIGDTFTAGANVNAAQIGEREQKRLLQDNAQQRYFLANEDRISYILGTNKQETNIIIVVVIAAIIFVTVLLIFRKK